MTWNFAKGFGVLEVLRNRGAKNRHYQKERGQRRYKNKKNTKPWAKKVEGGGENPTYRQKGGGGLKGYGVGGLEKKRMIKCTGKQPGK